MAGFSVEVDAKELESFLKKAPGSFQRATKRILLRSGIAHENVIKRNRFGGYRGESYADRLQRRSGRLAQAYKLFTPKKTGPDETEMVSAIRRGLPGSEYAKAQEFGAKIRPKRSKFLTVPLPRALTPAGVLSSRFRIHRKGDGYETAKGPTFIFRGRSGKLLVGIQGQSVRGGPVPFYVLKREVTIKPRFGFFKSWETLERGLIPKLVRRELDRAMREADR